MKVLCTQLGSQGGTAQSRSDWLTIGKIYHVLEIVGDVSRGRWLVRLMGDNRNGAALFPLHQFDLASPKIPTAWTISWDGETLSFGPAAWSRIGFWEEYYDRQPDAVRVFEQELQALVSADP